MTKLTPRHKSGQESVTEKQEGGQLKVDIPEGVDVWAEPNFDEADVKHSFLEESAFQVMFPEYRTVYLQENWERIKETLSAVHIKCDLDVARRIIEVATTGKTRDPFIIIKARDMVKLLARSVTLVQAKRVLQPNTFCEVITIGGTVRNKERFVRRRQRLIGPNGSTLKALELLTQCYVCVAGQTVCCIGPWQGIKKVREVVLDCMENVHPVYNLKLLMVKHELKNNDEMKATDWDRYLPRFKRTNQKRRKPVAPSKRDKDQKPVFPPQQLPRKEDVEMATLGDKKIKPSKNKYKRVHKQGGKSRTKGRSQAAGA